MNGIRAYLRHIRMARKMSQRLLAERLGISERAWINWELGNTEDLKGSVLIQTVAVLGASLHDMQGLLDKDAQTGREVAERLLLNERNRR